MAALGADFSADGHSLAAATSDRSLLIIDAETGETVCVIPELHEVVVDACFSPDGRKVLFTDGQASQAGCWDCKTATQIWSIERDNAGTKCVAWSPQGDVVASAGNDQVIHLRSPDSGKDLGLLKGHTDGVTALHFLPGTRRLLSASTDHTLRLWDCDAQAAIGEPFDLGAGHNRFGGVAGWPPVGGLHDGQPRTFRCGISMRSLVRTRNVSPARCWAAHNDSRSHFLPDGETIAAIAGRGVLETFDAESGRTVLRLSGCQSAGISVACSPAQRKLATVSSDGALVLWDLDCRWQSTQSLAGQPLLPVQSLGFSPDGRSMLVGTENRLTAEDTPDREATARPNVRRFSPPQPPLSFVTKRLVSTDGAPWDMSGPGFRCWDTATCQERRLPSGYPKLASIPLVACSSQGVLATGGNDGCVALWNEDGSLLARFPVNTQTPDATRLQPGEGKAPPAQMLLDSFDPVTTLVFSPDGGRLAVATKRGIIQATPARDWQRRTTLATEASRVACLAFAGDGRSLLVARDDKIHCFDVLDRSSRELGVPAGAAICSLAFNRAGELLAIGREDGTVRIEAARAVLAGSENGIGAQPSTLLSGHLDRVVAMSFSPSGETLATASWDATVRLWHVPSGQEVATLKGHRGKVTAIAFSPCGRILASAQAATTSTAKCLFQAAARSSDLRCTQCATSCGSTMRGGRALAPIGPIASAA